jgi:aconitase A
LEDALWQLVERLTGRDADQVSLVEVYARTAGFWAEDLRGAEYERVLEFDLSTVDRTMAGPSNPHRRLPTADLAERGIALGLEKAREEEKASLLPDGAVIIAAITSCTNTSNPRNVIAAALLAKKANALGLTRKPWVKTSFAPGSKVARLYLEEAGLLSELEALGFGIVAYACTTCNGMSGALDPAPWIRRSRGRFWSGTCTRRRSCRGTGISTGASIPMPSRLFWPRRAPYWDREGIGALAAHPRTLRDMRPLAILPDNITTDHLSPSNAILPTSAAGEYLARMGPAGGGLQFLRHPPGRSPDRHAGRLRQSGPSGFAPRTATMIYLWRQSC